MTLKGTKQFSKVNLTEDFKLQDSNMMDLERVEDFHAKEDFIFEKMVHPEEPQEYHHHWLDSLDKMHLAEKLYDVYKDRKTMIPGSDKSKKYRFYKYTKGTRVILLIISLILMGFQKPPWCEYMLGLWEVDQTRFDRHLSEIRAGEF